MSYYDSASLVMIPSGYKTSKVYSVKPTSGDGDLTFTRSNDTATRVGPDGLIEKVRTNLVLQSNTFNTSWSASNATVTSGQAGYDGTNNAWELNSSASGGRILQSNTQAGLQTFSVYAKGSVSAGIRLYAFGTVNANAYFNLNLGTVGAIGGSGVTAKIEAVGGGWYRCSISFDQTNVSVRLYTSDNANAEAAGTIYIQNAQLETGDIATEPILTTTAAVSVGPVANVPRLDYLGSSCPRLLLEPQRQNLALFSESFDNADWTKTGATITANNAVSPDGYTSADKLVEDTSTGNHLVNRNNAFVATGAFHTGSIFVKAGERTHCAISTRGEFGSPDKVIIFNLTTGVWDVNDSAQFEGLAAQQYANGWWRIIFNTDTTSAAYDGFTIGTAIGGAFWSDATYTGDGAYATSYIPTLGAAVTRGADAASKTGITSLIGQTEGTLFADIELNLAGSNVGYYALQVYDSASSPTYTKAAYIEIYQGKVYGYVRNTTIQGEIVSSTYADGTRLKIGFGYKANDFVLYVNGIQIGVDTSGSLPSVLNALSLHYSASTQQASPLSQALLFPTRLSNADLAALTA
jgi:hypothetical protein